MRVVTMVVLVLAGLAASCSDDAPAEATSSLVEMLLDSDAVADVLPDLDARTEYPTGENYGEMGPSELAVGPAGDATGGVVRQWSTNYFRHHDEPVRPAIVNVTSMALQFPNAEAAEAARDKLLSSVKRQGGEVVAHDTFDAAVTPPDNIESVSAVGATAVDDRLVTVEVNGVQRIDPTALQAVFDAAADHIR